ncbi:uncharacterized protein BP5553_06803 [Venustampulla echinocandica]|uniref:Wax synthase domain-containing protein n=1 Tax=Venustampulla echinocandica TaxID=2656787 RepID=A0A370TKY8_9HELO|nr:uncharacterized protein BP5553_06803 [Venustampulla echinocandica]RDL36191.1 hypothetical protein BP5553_06803 [Venustampulla echinocandica]
MEFPNFISPIPIHPILLLSLQILSSTLAVCYTPTASLWRPAVLPLQLIFVHSIVSSVNYMRPFWASLLGGLSFVLFLQFFDLNLLSKWSFEHNGPVDWVPSSGKKLNGATRTTEAHQNFHAKVSVIDTLWNRFRWGFNVNCALRHINTPQESKNCPHFHAQDPEYTPSRPVFLARSFLIAVCAYMTMDVFSSQPPPPDPATLFGADRVRFFTRLGDVTAEELAMRIMVTVAGFLNSYCLITGVPLLMSFFFVGFGLSEPRFWRPLFGSLLDAYSVRRFWGNFWHQNLRRMMGEPALFLSRSILHLPEGGILERYTKIMATFYISGVVHAIADLAGGLPWSKQLTVKFFVTQALGIIIEDTVEAVYRAICGKKRTPGPPAFWIRIVGYVWLAGFLVWSTPMWVYPGASRTSEGTRSILPYSVINREWT